MKTTSLTLVIGLLSTTAFTQVNDTGDNVGIGESNPQAKLHLNVSNVNSEILRLDNGGLRSTSFINYSDGTYDNAGLQFKKNSTAGQFKFSNINGDLMTISPTGTVHILNSNSNSELLTLDNGGLRTTSFINYSDGTYDNAGLQFKKNSTAGQFKFSNNNGDLMTILSNGNVGIGTSNIGNWQLAVGGKIRAEEIKVETGWADFVFEDNYELRSLEELENYIDENKHLPGIPTESQVTENGINLGEMNAKLLEKIEELTLYMIDMNNQMKSQTGRMERLEQENAELKNEISTLKNQ